MPVPTPQQKIKASQKQSKQKKSVRPKTFQDTVFNYCNGQKIYYGKVDGVKNNKIVIDDGTIELSKNVYVFTKYNQQSSLSSIKKGVYIKFAIDKNYKICAIMKDVKPPEVKRKATKPDIKSKQPKGSKGIIRKKDGTYTNY
jgi:hypothetical protein